MAHHDQFIAAILPGRRRQADVVEGDVWVPPTGSRLKLNVDALVRQGIGAAIGGVLRNNDGELLWVFAEWCDDIFDVDAAEALAMERGLEITRDCSINLLDLESDSQVMVNALIKPGINLSYFCRIIWNIENKAKAVGGVTFHWTRRRANIVAHKLAFYAFSCDSHFFSFHVPTS
ncbi:hypothetical protein ACS0TY_032991 [Phlomoides rotata]